MAKVMDLIKRFYSTFIHYFLIKLVFLYVHKWIQSRSPAVYICKEEYLILCSTEEDPNFHNRILPLDVTGNVCFYQFGDGGYSTRGVYQKCEMPTVLRTGFGPHTNDLLWYLRLKETQLEFAISLQTLNHALSFLSFFFSSISVSFALCVAFGVKIKSVIEPETEQRFCFLDISRCMKSERKL